MLILLGCNHRSAPVGLRERMAFPQERIRESLASLLARGPIREGMILSTCNRVEVLARCEGDPQRGLETLAGFLSDQHGISPRELAKFCYRMTGREVVLHLFGVASGLDSMILGEPQILGQVKQAYLLAKESRATGPVLERLLQHALATAKRVRTETGISRNAVSVAFAAVKLAGNIFGDLTGRSGLLLGAGKMSELVARHFAKNGVSPVIVTSRTYDNAVVSAERCGGRAVYWENGLGQLSKVDVLVCCTAAPGYVLSKADVSQALRARRNSPLFIIDIAVPRDVDPAVNELDNVYLYDIDGLQGVVDSNKDERRHAAEQARRLIGGEAAAFDRWRQSLEVAPLIVSLRESLIGLGRREVERFRGRLGPLTPQQEGTVEELTLSLINKILHRPIRHLHRSVERGAVNESAAVLREIFGLDPGRPAAPPEAESPRAREGDPRGPQRLLRGGKKD